MDTNSQPSKSNRSGFHYFPDTLHYREKDLQKWLPVLHRLGASWLTLLAPSQRAIPEYFLKELISNGIEPVLHFPLSLDGAFDFQPLQLLLNTYPKWGVQYVVLFDRPNNRSAWPSSGWTQADLVDRFLDLYLPQAEICLQAGLRPVFPPLEPGGDYWDTAFLRAALRSIQRRRKSQLLEALVLSAYAFTGPHDLNWGAGGPERWPSARPYVRNSDIPDQRGFRIFDWYLGISQAELGIRLPMMLVKAGHLLAEDDEKGSQSGQAGHAQQNLSIARLMAGEVSSGESLEPAPSEILACNFWLLSAEEGSPYYRQAWFPPGGSPLPAAIAIEQWASKHRQLSNLSLSKTACGKNQESPQAKAIDHYLLMPLYAWGPAEWDLENVRYFIQRHHPTMGFSVQEAERARQVTLVGEANSYPEGTIERLRSAGCEIEQLGESGTLIATQTLKRDANTGIPVD